MFRRRIPDEDDGPASLFQLADIAILRIGVNHQPLGNDLAGLQSFRQIRPLRHIRQGRDKHAVRSGPHRQVFPAAFQFFQSEPVRSDFFSRHPAFGKQLFIKLLQFVQRPVVSENRFQPFDSGFQLRGTQPEQDIPLPDRPCPARQLRRQVAALGNGHEPTRRRNRLPRQRDAPRQRQKQDSRQNHQRGCARKPARPSGGTLRQRPDRPDLPPARINQNAVKLQNHHHHGHRLYKAVIDDQNDRSVQENPVKERPDAETEQQHAVFAARFCAEPEEMPAPALPDVFAGTRHQVFDIHQVAEDVVAVVADERVAVHEKSRNGADRKDIEHRRLPCARRQIGPQQGRDAAEQQLGNDSRRVDQQPFPARQPPAVGGIRVQPRIEHHEPHPDPAHPAVEVNCCQRVRRLMDQFQEQNRRKILRQPRPGKRIEENGTDRCEVAQYHEISDQCRNRQRKYDRLCRDPADARPDLFKKALRAPRRQPEKKVCRRKTQKSGLLPLLRLPLAPDADLAVFGSEQVVLPEECQQFHKLAPLQRNAVAPELIEELRNRHGLRQERRDIEHGRRNPVIGIRLPVEKKRNFSADQLDIRSQHAGHRFRASHFTFPGSKVRSS